MRSTTSLLTKKLKVGDVIPSARVFVGVPPSPVDIATRFSKGRFVLFGVPGAFTPGCSKTHLPGYVRDASKIKQKFGVEEIACIAKNDSFVMDAWSAVHDPTKSVTMIADPNGEFAVNSGLTVDLPVLGGQRFARFAMIIADGKVESLWEEPDGKGLTCSLSDSILSKL